MSRSAEATVAACIKAMEWARDKIECIDDEACKACPFPAHKCNNCQARIRLDAAIAKAVGQ